MALTQMLQVVLTLKSKPFEPCVYVCSVKAAFELWFILKDCGHSISVRSMNGAQLKTDEHHNPIHGIHSFYDLASDCAAS